MTPNTSIDLDDLYQDIILDHYKHPRHAAKLTPEEALVDEENPTCGDQILLTLDLEDGCVTNVRYAAHGCAISVASASMMSELLTGKPEAEARQLIQDFVAVMKGEKDLDPELGDVVALEGVKKFPLRIKCATMSWHALLHALEKRKAEGVME